MVNVSGANLERVWRMMAEYAALHAHSE
jgi:hypothetical protein